MKFVFIFFLIVLALGAYYNPVPVKEDSSLFEIDFKIPKRLPIMLFEQDDAFVEDEL